VGGIVELRGARTCVNADRNIAAVADGGIYKTSTHLALAKAGARSDQIPQALSEAHVRRSRHYDEPALSNGSRKVTGRYRHLQDPRSAIRRRTRDGALGRAQIASSRSSSRCAPWAQRGLIGSSFPDRRALRSRACGSQVREALRDRECSSWNRDWPEKRGQQVILARNLLSALRTRDLEGAAAAIASETGLTYRGASDGEPVAGVYRRSLMLASGRFAMLDDGMGFTLVPWRS